MANTNLSYQPYTYIVEDTLTGKKYCGSKYGKDVTPENTTDYFGSPSKDSEYYTIIQTRSHTLVKKIINVFSTKEETIADEIRLHTLYNVAVNEEFYNRTNQQSTGFLCVGGYQLSEETKQRMSDASKGKPKSEEHRQKIAETIKNLGRIYTHSKETRLKISAARKGKPAHNKGKPLSDEHRQKLSAAAKGKTHSAETRLKMSLAKKEK